MQFTALGKRSDMQVSAIALGCWPFAGGDVWGAQEDADSIAAVHAALDEGINFFDTAEGYGRSEEVLGRGLKGRRHEATIATKVSEANLAADGILSACERSLRALQTDYIDLFQIHWPNWDVPLAETVGELETLQEEGKIRAYGVCNFAEQDLSEMIALGQCVTDQLPYNLAWRGIERAVLPLCRANGVGVICYSPLAQGVLTGRYANADEMPEGLARTRLYRASGPCPNTVNPATRRNCSRRWPKSGASPPTWANLWRLSRWPGRANRRASLLCSSARATRTKCGEISLPSILRCQRMSCGNWLR